MANKWKLSVNAHWLKNNEKMSPVICKFIASYLAMFGMAQASSLIQKPFSWQNGNSASLQMTWILPTTVHHILHCLGPPRFHAPLPQVNAGGFLGLVLGQWHLGESQLCRAFTNVCSATHCLPQRAYFLNCQRNTCGIAETREKLSILLLNWHSTHATLRW